MASEELTERCFRDFMEAAEYEIMDRFFYITSRHSNSGSSLQLVERVRGEELLIATEESRTSSPESLLAFGRNTLDMIRSIENDQGTITTVETIIRGIESRLLQQKRVFPYFFTAYRRAKRFMSKQLPFSQEEIVACSAYELQEIVRSLRAEKERFEHGETLRIDGIDVFVQRLVETEVMPSWQSYKHYCTRYHPVFREVLEEVDVRSLQEVL